MSENWNMSGLILEGVCGTGKSTLFEALLQSERFVRKSFLSSVVLSEHQTQRVLERKEREEGLVKSDNTSLLEQHVAYIENMHERLEQMPWRENNRTNMRILYLFERFHLTHVCHYAHVSWADVQDFDTRLAKLNCKLCLLVMDDSVLEHRIVSSRNAAWREYLSRYGKTNDEILNYYSTQQKMLRSLCDKSEVETLLVDTSETTPEKIVDCVIDFWGALEDGYPEEI